jgi:hypothetical protein
MVETSCPEHRLWGVLACNDSRTRRALLAGECREVEEEGYHTPHTDKTLFSFSPFVLSLFRNVLIAVFLLPSILHEFPRPLRRFDNSQRAKFGGTVGLVAQSKMLERFLQKIASMLGGIHDLQCIKRRVCISLVAGGCRCLCSEYICV